MTENTTGRLRPRSGEEIHAVSSGTLAVGVGRVGPMARKKDHQTGFLDHIRPRSKSDAKAICNTFVFNLLILFVN